MSNGTRSNWSDCFISNMMYCVIFQSLPSFVSLLGVAMAMTTTRSCLMTNKRTSTSPRDTRRATDTTRRTTWRWSRSFSWVDIVLTCYYERNVVKWSLIMLNLWQMMIKFSATRVPREQVFSYNVSRSTCNNETHELLANSLVFPWNYFLFIVIVPFDFSKSSR
jgi:hypothetical protein